MSFATFCDRAKMGHMHYIGKLVPSIQVDRRHIGIAGGVKFIIEEGARYSNGEPAGLTLYVVTDSKERPKTITLELAK